MGLETTAAGLLGRIARGSTPASPGVSQSESEQTTAAGLLGRIAGSLTASPKASPSGHDDGATGVTHAKPGGKRLPHPVVLKMRSFRRLKGPKVAKRRLISAASILPYRPRSGSETDRRQSQHAKVQAELALQGATPLCFENVDRLFPDMRDVVLGNRVFRLIELTDAIHPGKVTGMILEGCTTREIYDLLHGAKESEAADAILALVDDANEVLRCAREHPGYDGTRTAAGEESSKEASSDATASAAEEETPPPTPTERTTPEPDEWHVVANPKRRRSPSER